MDNNILIAGRSFDQGTWIRRSTKEALGVNGRTSPLPPGTYIFAFLPSTYKDCPNFPGASESIPDEKGSALSMDTSVVGVGVDLPDQVRFNFCGPKLLSYLILG